MGNNPAAMCGVTCSKDAQDDRQCLSKLDRMVDFEGNLPFSKMNIDEFERLALSAAKIIRNEDGLYSPPLNQSTLTLRQLTKKFSSHPSFS